MAYNAKSDGAWVDKAATGGTATSNLIDAGDTNRWESNQLDAHTRLTALESSGGGSGSIQLMEAAARTVWARSPSPGSGLTAVTVGGSTSQTTVLQAQLNYVESTWGSGTVQLPAGTIVCNAGLTVPDGVQLAGISKQETVLSFTGAGTSVVAVTAGGRGTFPLRDLSLVGPNTTDKLGYPTNTCTGARLHGIDCRIQNVSITRFFYGLDLTESDSFFFLGDNISIGNAGVCIDMDQSASHNGGSSPTENGERMVLTNSVLFNSQVGFDAKGSGVGLFVSNTSFDYLGVHGIAGDSFIFMTNCHLETGYAPTDNANWGSINRYMFKPFNTARMGFENCRFEVRDTGVFQVADNGVGPASYNSGHIRFSNCTWFGTMPGATPGTAPHGETRQFQSKDMVNWQAGDGATKVIKSPFGTKWNTINAYPVSSDGRGIPSGHSFRVTAAAVSSVAGATPSQDITLARDLASGATATDTWVCIEY